MTAPAASSQTHAGALFPPDDGEALTWAMVSAVTEGIAFAQRPLRAATEGVTQRHSLGPRGAFILSAIANGQCFPAEISQIFKVSRSLITAELARLTEAGLIVARVGDKDRRRTELALTAQGAAACLEVRTEMARIIRRNLSGYTPQEVALFGRMLRDVRHDPQRPEAQDAWQAILHPE